MHRLFVALRPPREVRELLLGVMGGVSGARWQDDDQLHITLRFIGDVDSRTAEDAAMALASVCAPPLDLQLAGCGVFCDSRGRVNALWAGVGPREPLAALHRKVDHAMIRAGLEAEHRAYQPHITLARLAGSAGSIDGFLAAHAALTSAPFRVEHIMLYESTLGQGGSVYEPVERYALTGS